MMALGYYAQKNLTMQIINSRLLKLYEYLFITHLCFHSENSINYILTDVQFLELKDYNKFI